VSVWWCWTAAKQFTITNKIIYIISIVFLFIMCVRTYINYGICITIRWCFFLMKNNMFLLLLLLLSMISIFLTILLHYHLTFSFYFVFHRKKKRSDEKWNKWTMKLLHNCINKINKISDDQRIYAAPSSSSPSSLPVSISMRAAVSIIFLSSMIIWS